MQPTSQVILVSMYARGIRVTTDRRRVGEGGRVRETNRITVGDA